MAKATTDPQAGEHRTLTGRQVETTTIPEREDLLRVVNQGGGPLTFRLDRLAPIANAAGTYRLGGGQGAELIIPTPGTGPVTVTIAGTGEHSSYSVDALPHNVAEWPKPRPPAA